MGGHVGASHVGTIATAQAAPGGAPSVRHVTLRDGALLRVRPIGPDDEPRLRTLFGRLSRRTIYQRFFRPYDRLPEEWYRRFANVDHVTRLAIVAEEPGVDDPPLRAVARYEPGGAPGVAEVAVVVEDAWQGRGLGPVLLDALLAEGEARGVHTFTADVLAHNRPMLRALSRVAHVRRRALDGDVLTLEFERAYAIGAPGRRKEARPWP